MYSSFRFRFLFAVMISLFGIFSVASADVNQFEKLENAFDGRLGIYAINTADNQHIQNHSSVRFPVQSTSKVMVVSAILKKSMQNKELLQQKIFYKRNDLVFWSPITEKHLDDGMTISELCAAALMYSDNTATNILMKKLGGPRAVTKFARSMGDKTFRIDNLEPNLKSDPHSVFDTSTPIEIVKNLQKLTFGNVLDKSKRDLLITWMKSNTTGDTRIRAGVPKGWIVADKTGTDDTYGIANDIGIVWPQNCKPIIVAIYSINNKKNAKHRDDVVALATRILIEEFAQHDECIKRSF